MAYYYSVRMSVSFHVGLHTFSQS